MTDNATWTLQVRVEGIALWMHRGTHIDVLFPDDRLRIDNDEHHYVTLHRDKAGLGDGGQPVSHAMLDFTTLPVLPYTQPVTPGTGSIPLVVEADALAKAENAATIGTGLVASLRLPLGALASLGDELGPFVFGNHKTLHLSYGMSWTGRLTGRQALRISSIAHGVNGSKTEVQLPGGPANADRSVTVRCLSRRDRRDKEEIKDGEHLHEVAFFGHIATNSKAPLSVVPQYKPNHLIAATPRRPCPPAYSSPFV